MRSVLIPVTSPFRSEPGSSLTSFDDAAFKSNVLKWNQTGIGGYVILGSTGERVHLDEREYLHVIETARDLVPADLRFIVGAGQQSTQGTVAEVKRAQQAGADAVLVITPHFYRSAITQDTLFGFYNAVADASPVPVMLYSMPALTGVKIEPSTIARLSEHPNIIGAKDSSSDVAGFAETVKSCREGFEVMTGNGTVFFDAVKAGATGAILAVGCAVPEICVELMNAFNARDNERAASIQGKLTPFAHAVTVKYGIAGLKAALDMNGYAGGEVRAPLMAVSNDAKAEIGALLEELKDTFRNLVSTTAQV